MATPQLSLKAKISSAIVHASHVNPPGKYTVTGLYGPSKTKSLVTDNYGIALRIFKEFCQDYRIVQVSERERCILHQDDNM